MDDKRQSGRGPGLQGGNQVRHFQQHGRRDVRQRGGGRSRKWHGQVVVHVGLVRGQGHHNQQCPSTNCVVSLKFLVKFYGVNANKTIKS